MKGKEMEKEVAYPNAASPHTAHTCPAGMFGLGRRLRFGCSPERAPCARCVCGAPEAAQMGAPEPSLEDSSSGSSPSCSSGSSSSDVLLAAAASISPPSQPSGAAPGSLPQHTTQNKGRYTLGCRMQTGSDTHTKGQTFITLSIKNIHFNTNY